MNRFLRVCVCCAAVGWASSSAALSVMSSYEFIAGRNVFNLQPVLAPIPLIHPAPPKAMPKMTITGITDICGRRQVLVEISEPGRPAIKPVMTEGEQVGVVKVLHIDVERGLVNVQVHGEASTLALSSFSAPAASPQPPPPMPISSSLKVQW